jgi:hypothetical protein
MSFFFAFCTAGFLGIGFAALAFRYARTLCLHILVFWVFFVAAPLATAWLYTGEITSRALIGQDLYSFALADALSAHVHLYVLYGLGVLFVAILFRDRQIADGVVRTLAAQRFNIMWSIAFAAVLLAEFLLKLSYGVLLSGSGTAERIADMPYIVSSLLAVLGSVIFGLYCYLCVLSARAKPLLVLCLAYLPYVLATDGRRAMTMALVTFFLLRGLSLGFRPNWRLARIAGATLALFILVGPIFMEARAISETLQEAGVPPIAALAEGVSQAIDLFMRGESGFAAVADNVAERGNAGVFFLTVAERHIPPQLGAMTWASFLWAVPSIFIVKPELQVEGMIQLLANMRLLDDADSMPLILYADFGAFGLLVAGAYTAALLFGLAKLLCGGRQFGIFEIVALGTFFSLSFGIENELSGQFVVLRNLALFAPVALLSRFLASGPRKGRRRPAARPPQPRHLCPASLAMTPPPPPNYVSPRRPIS